MLKTPAPETPAPEEFLTAAVKVGTTVVGGARAAYVAIGALAGLIGGFAVVVTLWAVALVAGIVTNKLMRPEMDKRATRPKLWTTEVGSLPWRLGRAMWVRLVLNRSPGAGEAASLRWPSLDTGYGELSIQGYLEFILRPGERIPQGAADKEDFYGGLEWFHSRLENSPAPAELLNLIAGARQIAQAYATGVAFAAGACGKAAGESLNDPPRSANLWFEGLGLLGPAGAEQGGAAGLQQPESELSAAYLTGLRDGVDWSSRVAVGFGGQQLLTTDMAPAIARQIARWTPALGYGPVTVSETGELAMTGGVYTPFGNTAPDVAKSNVMTAISKSAGSARFAAAAAAALKAQLEAETRVELQSTRQQPAGAIGNIR